MCSYIKSTFSMVCEFIRTQHFSCQPFFAGILLLYRIPTVRLNQRAAMHVTSPFMSRRSSYQHFSPKCVGHASHKELGLYLFRCGEKPLLSSTGNAALFDVPLCLMIKRVCKTIFQGHNNSVFRGTFCVIFIWRNYFLSQKLITFRQQLTFKISVSAIMYRVACLNIERVLN